MAEVARKETTKPVQQFALYYPHIHVRDVNWLKSTLLWFGQVRRIVPEQFTLDDIPEVKTFTQTQRPGGTEALLEVVRLWEQPVLEAKTKLQKQIEANLPAITQKYARPNTPEALQNSFRIHRYKLLDTPRALPDVLLENALAWQAPAGPDAYNWLFMHPKLGAAIMSTLALAVARNEGLGIVTPDQDVHTTLLAEREADVFNALLDLPVDAAPTSGDDLADDLAQLVFTTQFDLSVLTAADIKILIEEKKDLSQFRFRVMELVSDIPAGIGPTERIKRLENRKKDILHEWDEYRSVLPKFAKEALAESTAEEAIKKAGEHLPELREWAGGMAAHGITGAVVGGAPGFAFSVVASAALKMWRTKDSPTRFLSNIDRAVDRARRHRTASLMLPQWSKLARV